MKTWIDRLLCAWDDWCYNRDFLRGQAWAYQNLKSGKTTSAKIMCDCYVPTTFSGSFAFDEGAYNAAMNWREGYKS